MRLETNEEVYLGLPTYIGRSKKEIFASLEERIRNKVGNWKVRFLSKAGRKVLIKSVLQAIPTYVMSFFLLPLDTCDRIEKRLCDFYWGSMNGERKLHWRSWGKMCRSQKEGGLGFHRIHSFNKAMLAGWRLMTTPNSLTARIYKARYYPRSSILDAKEGYRPSHAWRSIIKGLQLLRTGLDWRVGYGEHINIWNDSWLPMENSGAPAYHLPGSDMFQMVAELRLPDSATWNEVLLNRIFSEEDALLIKSIRISPPLPADIIRWRFTKEGDYTVRSGYYQDLATWWATIPGTNSHSHVSNFWSYCWNLESPPRLLNFLWRLLDNNLLVWSNLHRRGIIENTVCPMCDQHAESIEHLFMLRPTSKALMRRIGIHVGLNEEKPFGEAWALFIMSQGQFQGGRLCAAFWGVWKIRNNMVFGNTSQNHDVEMNKVLRFFMDFIENRNVTSNSASKTPAKWVPPPEGTLKVNTDAGVLASGGGQISAIARYHCGGFLKAVLQHISQTQHPTMLEAYGILIGLNLAKTLAVNSVIVESDCLPIIQALQSRKIHRGDLSLIIEDCLSAASELEDVQFTFIPRSGNQPAHLLAKLPGFFSSCIQFYDVVNAEITASLEADVRTVT